MPEDRQEQNMIETELDTAYVVRVLNTFNPKPNAPVCTAYYGPQSAAARAAVIGELTGVPTPRSAKSVQWNNWFTQIAFWMGINRMGLCIAEIERLINDLCRFQP